MSTSAFQPMRKGFVYFQRHSHGNYAEVAYTPPINTCDARYSACTDHHVACDCREAEFAEYRSEVAYENDARRKAYSEILASHPTYTHERHDEMPCMCTGCQIARATHQYPR